MLIFMTQIYAQDINLSMSCAETVQVGQPFELKIVLNNARASSFQEPDLSNFQILGVSQYQSSGGTTVIINGKVVQEGNSAHTWVYTLSAKKAGKFTIAAAKAVAGGKTYTSNTLTVTASGSASTTSDVTASGELFIDVTLNKTEAYLGEQIVATARFYSRYDIAGFEDAVFPTFEGFWNKDIYSPTNIQFEMKSISGKKYLTALWHQKLLIPQQTGKLKIGQYKVGCLTGYGFFANERRDAASVEKEITIKPLPTTDKPANFSGAVGTFKFNASIDKQKANVNDPITLKIKIEGNGNLELFDFPKANIPSTFNIYDEDPDEVKAIKVAAEGTNGSREIEYVLIPRAPGNFVIPALEFSYFDPATRKYNTIESDTFKITIEGQADTTANNLITIKNEVEDLGNDILYINTTAYNFKKTDYTFFGTLNYYLILLAALLLFLIITFIKRQQIKLNSDAALVKNRKANKISLRRLKTANLHMKTQKAELFYEEVLKALWGYLSDKFTIAVSDLKRDNILEQFIKYNLPQDIVNQFITLLDSCEFARFAPSSTHDIKMQDIYNDAYKIIGLLEQHLKN